MTSTMPRPITTDPQDTQEPQWPRFFSWLWLAMIVIVATGVGLIVHHTDKENSQDKISELQAQNNTTTGCYNSVLYTSVILTKEATSCPGMHNNMYTRPNQELTLQQLRAGQSYVFRSAANIVDIFILDIQGDKLTVDFSPGHTGKLVKTLGLQELGLDREKDGSGFFLVEALRTQP